MILPDLKLTLKHIAGAMAVIAIASCTGSSSTESKPTVGAQQVTDGSLFDKSIADIRNALDERRAQGVPVPIPVDAGGGYTHEQHKQNAKTIYEAGMLYRQTGDESYRDFAKSILTDYADMYPTLGLHPKRKEGHPAGRLFWQGLNEAWWLVYVSQGYEAIRADLTEDERNKIETALLRPVADFLSEGSPKTFNRIHNHGTWSAAAVGMTGYVLDDRDYVDKALYGLDKSGDAGFLKQIDLLFSPDGYYAEGPYYQRYALMPFVLFAQSIEKNDPDVKIFDHRDGVLRKAITATIQQSYAGRFFPINDAIREKGLNTAELRYAVAIAYDLTKDPTLLSIVKLQKSIVPTPEGKALSQAIAAGKAQPFVFKTLKLRDGPKGDRGALITLRSGPEPDAAAVVFKAASQGLGHGHFDRLGLLYYDNGDEIIADYGAARFLNVEPKNGGHYLLENTTWAKQTIAHNTLVVDQSSQFSGDWKRGEEHTPTILAFDDTPGASLAAAQINTAYDGVTYTRMIAMVEREDAGSYIVDVIHATSDADHVYDLPVHFKGQLIETSLPFKHSTERLTPLGESAGYQHLWKTAEAQNIESKSISDFSFVISDQFYSLTFASDHPIDSFLTRLGANDPDNNLRNEQALILRSYGRETNLVSVYERHGLYDNDEEVTLYSGSSIEDLTISQSGDTSIYAVTPKTGGEILILFSANPSQTADHSVVFKTETLNWRGPVSLKIIETSENNKKNPEE